MSATDAMTALQAALVEAGALEAALVLEGQAVTLRRHVRTETAVDLATGRARAAMNFRFFTEPL